MDETWSGLDRPPKWLTALDAVGQTREQFRVKGESSPGNPMQKARPVDSGAYHIEWPRKEAFACLAPHMGVT